jgi:hypothetical protein
MTILVLFLCPENQILRDISRYYEIFQDITRYFKMSLFKSIGAPVFVHTFAVEISKK